MSWTVCSMIDLMAVWQYGRMGIVSVGIIGIGDGMVSDDWWAVDALSKDLFGFYSSFLLVQSSEVKIQSLLLPSYSFSLTLSVLLVQSYSFSLTLLVLLVQTAA